MYSPPIVALGVRQLSVRTCLQLQKRNNVDIIVNYVVCAVCRECVDSPEHIMLHWTRSSLIVGTVIFKTQGIASGTIQMKGIDRSPLQTRQQALTLTSIGPGPCPSGWYYSY